MDTYRIPPGRHRLGMVDGVHCILIPQVADALAEHRRNWFTSLLSLSPARHSFASMRRRSAAMGTGWSAASPATS